MYRYLQIFKVEYVLLVNEYFYTKVEVRRRKYSFTSKTYSTLNICRYLYINV